MTSTTYKRKCAGKTKDGKPCNAWAMEGSDYCFMHDPNMVKERAKARSMGGKARHGRKVGITGNEDPLTIETMGDVVKLLEGAVNDCLALENSIARARAIATLAGTLIKALEYATLEERVEALEETLKAREVHSEA